MFVKKIERVMGFFVSLVILFTVIKAPNFNLFSRIFFGFMGIVIFLWSIGILKESGDSNDISDTFDDD